MYFENEFDVPRGVGRMVVTGLSVEFNLPRMLEQSFRPDTGEEVDLPLPPYSPRAAFNVEDFEACPPHWMRGGPDAGSYFVPVKVGRGIWLDLNANTEHTHHVAALISIQGVNAVTGMKAEPLRLEQYRERCPTHDQPFGADRFCKDCGFMWPLQNYLATTGTPHGLFWLDGFRAKDGAVRQFYFTEEELRGIAAQVLGQDRVFAIGVAFYLSKEPKPVAPPMRIRRSPAFWDDPVKASNLCHGFQGDDDGPTIANLCSIESLELGGSEEVLRGPARAAAAAALPPAVRYTPAARRVVATPPPRTTTPAAPVTPKRLEVAAGARIDQQVYPDPQELGFWRDVPAAVIYVNYVDEAAAREILKSKIDRTGRGEGFMQDLVVGTPRATE